RSSAGSARRDSSWRRLLSCGSIRMPLSSRFERGWEAIYVVAALMPGCCSQFRMQRKERRNMAKVDWPAPEKRSLIGKRISRVDGPMKATGAAKYSYDINRPGMLWAKVVTSPYAHAEVTNIDTSAAEALPGVKGVWRDTEKEARYAGEIVAAVAAVTEEIAEEAARLVKVDYKPLEHQVVDTDPALSKEKPSKKDQGNVDEAFGKADKVVEGEYGIPVITHCCLESHGQVTEVRDGELYVWPSTQNVSRYSDR